MPKYCAVFLLMLVQIQCTSDDPLRLEISEPPEKVTLFGAEFLSTPLYERDMAIAPDGSEMIYTLGDYRQRRRVLVSLRKEGSAWSSPSILEFSGLGNDIEPFFSPDGVRLFFASDRPMDGSETGKDYNIWMVEKNSQGWSDPVALGSNINTDADEFYPAATRNGNLYFTSTRENGIGREDIFVSKFRDNQYQPAEPLDSQINSPLYEFNAFVDPDEQFIIFTSYGRPDDLGGGDLYISKKDTLGRWMEALHLGSEINSNKLDYCPFVDIPRAAFYFTSERGTENDSRISSIEDFWNYSDDVLNGLGNIFWVGIDQLDL